MGCIRPRREASRGLEDLPGLELHLFEGLELTQGCNRRQRTPTIRDTLLTAPPRNPPLHRRIRGKGRVHPCSLSHSLMMVSSENSIGHRGQ